MESHKKYPYWFFLGLLLLVTLVFFSLIKNYLLAVFWAVVLALLFRGLHRKMLDRFDGKKNLAAAVTLTLIILFVIVPFIIIGSAIVSEGVEFYQALESGEFHVRETLENLRTKTPIIENTLQRLSIDVEQVRTSVNESFANLARNFAGYIFSFTQNFVSFAIQFFLMLYILYFFLRDGRWILEKLVWAIPLGDDKEWRLIERFESVTRATVRGSLVVAVLQGTIGALLFLFVGIPGAALWGVLMTFCALLPMGSGIIWLPAAVIFMIQGDFTRGIIIVLVGSLIIGLLDNFLRPRLVGNDTKLPDYLILLSTLGGLAWFGISGFALGPIIAALFVTCWQMLGDEFSSPTGSEDIS